MIRPSPRQRALWFLAAALLIVVSCLGDPTGPSARTGGIALAPRFGNAMASAIVDVTAVRLRLNRPGELEAVLDTVIQFPADADTLELSLEVPMESSREEFELRLAMTNAQGDTVFRAGPLLVTATTARDQEPAEPEFIYVGTGANATGVRFVDPPLSVPFGASVTLQAEAFDAQSSVIAGTPIGFELVTRADTVRARITDPRAGTFVAGTQRGSVAVQAVLASGQTAAHTIVIQPVATALVRVSGNSQVGTVGQPLAAPLVAKVVAADELGVQGSIVEWAVVTGLADTIATEIDTTDADGHASYSLTLSASAGEHEVYARIAGSADAFVVFSATAEPTAPAGLSFVAEPTNVVATQAIAPAVQVAVLDAQGNVNTAATDVITLTLHDAQGAAVVLNGTASAAAVAGVATFADLSANPAGTGYTLRASAGSLAPDTSAAFDVVAGPAVALVFTQQPPAGVIAGAAILVEVEAHDAGGNRIQIPGTVDIAFGVNPGGGTLGGTLSATMTEHVVQFADLTVGALGAGYTLVASSAGLASATSSAFTVTEPPEVNAWINEAGGNWSVAANWSRGVVPSATDTVWIKVPGSYTVVVDVPTTVGRVELGAPSGLQIVDVTSTLTLADTFVVASTGRLNLLSGAITGPGDARVHGHFGWSGGTLDGAGVIRVPAGGTMAITGAAGRAFMTRTIELGGLGLWSGTHSINSGLGATWRVLPGGNVDIQGDANWVYNQGGAPALFDVQGNVLRTVSANTVQVPALAVSGTLAVMTGTLETRGAAGSSGTLSALAGATLAFGPGTHTLGAGSRVEGDGTVAILAGATVTASDEWGVTGATVVSGGALDFTGTVGSTGTFELLAGRKGGSGMFMVTAQMTWTGGDLNGGGGTTRVVDGGSLTIDGTAGRSLMAHALELAGTGTWSGTHGVNSGLGGVLSVLPTGSLEIAGNPNWVYNQGGTQPVFDVQGFVNKTSAGGASVPGLAVSGTLLVEAGTLSASNTGVSSGVLEAAVGGLLLFNAGTQTLDAASTVQGDGTVQVAGGTVTTAGTWAVAGTTQLTGGIFTLNGTGSTGTLLVDGGSRRGVGLLSVTDAGSWTGGAFDQGVGTTRFLPGSNLTISGVAGRSLMEQVIEIGGSATWAGTHGINSGIGGVLRVLPTGTLDLTGDATLVYNQGGAEPVLDVQGAMTRTTSAGLATVAGLSVSGTLTVNTGTLEARNTGTSSGTLTAAPGGTLRFGAGTHTLAPSSTVGGAGVVAVATGTVTSSGAWAVTGTTVISGGVLTYDGPGASTGVLDLSGGTIGGGGLVAVTGNLSWTGGNVSGGGGILRVAPSATFSISGGAGRSLVTHTLELEGSGAWTDAGGWNTGVGAVLRVAPGGSLDIQGTAALVYNQGGTVTSILNDGTVTRSVSAGVALIQGTWTNTGAINVTTGTLDLRGGGTMGGTVTTLAGATLSFGANPFVMQPLFVAGGTGDVVLNGGTLTSALVTDTAHFARLRLLSGTLSPVGVVRVSSLLAWEGPAALTSGTVRLDAPGALEISGNGNYQFTGATLENGGSATWSGTASLSSGLGARLVNLANATFDWAGDGSFLYQQGGVVPEFINEGQFARTSAGTATLGAFLRDTVGQDWRLDAGELHLSGGGRLGGAPYTGGVLRIVSGTLSQQSGITWQADGGRVVVAGGTFTVDSGGTATVADLELAAGSVTHEGTIVIENAFLWTSGTLSSNQVGLGGETQVGASANVQITGTATKTFVGAHRLRNAGTTIQFDGTGDISGGVGAVIDNGGTFEFNGTGAIVHNQGGSATFINQSGAILRNGGASVAVMNFPIDNQGGVLEAAGERLRLTGGSVNNFFGNSVQTGGIPIELGGGAFALTAPFNFGGDLEVTTGSLTPGATVATVNGNLTTSGGGSVSIAQPTAVFTVDGNATFGGALGAMTAGRLDVAGDFTQASASANFQPTGTHVTRFNGAGHQVVTFQVPGLGTNRFNDVELLNTASGADSVVLGSDAYATGNLTVTTGILGNVEPWRFTVLGNALVAVGAGGSGLRPFVLDVAGTFPNGTLGITPDTLVLNNPGTYAWTNLPSAAVHQRFNAGVVTFGATSAPGDLIASGSGVLDMPGGNRAVFGDFRTENNGVLRMTSGGSLSVSGDATFGGGSTTGLLTAGALDVSGNFTQAPGGSAAAYAASGNHRTVLTGTASTTVSFADPATSQFDSLVVWKGQFPRSTVTLLSDVRVTGGMTARDGSDIVGPTARLSVSGGPLEMVLSTASPTIQSLRALEISTTPTIGSLVSPDTVVLNAGIATLPVAPALQYQSIRLNTGSTVAITNDTIQRDLDIQSGIAAFVGTANFRVLGKLRARGTGSLAMISTDANVSVLDSAIFSGASNAGNLSAGTLTLGGAFFQGGGSPSAFSASGTHSTVLAGGSLQPVFFANPGNDVATSHFANMQIGNVSPAGIQLESPVIAVGQLRSTFGRPAISRVSSLTGDTLGVGGLSADSITFARVPIRSAGTVASTRFDVITFESMDPAVNQLMIRSPAGVLNLNQLFFMTQPNPGVFLFAAHNLSTVAGLTVNVGNPNITWAAMQTPQVLYQRTGSPTAAVLNWFGQTLP